MKPLKLFFAIFLVALLPFSNALIGQTVNLYARAEVTDGFAWCLNRNVYGYVIYHLTYHIDKKTGFADRGHANVHQAELYDSETDERYIYIDTGNDNSGVSWEFWNDPSMGGTNSFVYDQPSYNIPIGTLPAKGGNVWATFKLISKGGEKFTMRSVTRFILLDDGTLQVVSNKEYIDCNE